VAVRRASASACAVGGDDVAPSSLPEMLQGRTTLLSSAWCGNESAGLTQEPGAGSRSAAGVNARGGFPPARLGVFRTFDGSSTAKVVYARCTRTKRGAGCSEVTADYFSAENGDDRGAVPDHGAGREDPPLLDAHRARAHSIQANTASAGARAAPVSVPRERTPSVDRRRRARSARSPHSGRVVAVRERL